MQDKTKNKSNQKLNNKHYIFLTNLDRSLAGSKKGICLGLWCYSKKELLKTRNPSYLTLDYFSGTQNQQINSYKIVSSTYKKMLPKLTKQLNIIHSSDYTPKFWEILIGYWLRQYLDVLHDRYTQLTYAKKQYPKSIIQSFNECEIQVLRDTEEFSVSIFSELFNQQLFEQINLSLNLFESENIIEKPNVKKQLIGRNFRNEKIISILSLVSCLLGKFNKVVFVRTYFSKKLLWQLSFRFRSIPIIKTPRLRSKLIKKNKVLRNLLHIESDDTFEKLAFDLLRHYIPSSYLERFNELRKLSKFTYPSRAKIFISANAFSGQEVYKFWTASAINDNKADHIILQHGGNYGRSKIMSEEDYEMSSSSYYITKGWHRDNVSASVIPFVASPYLQNIGSYKKQKPIFSNNNKITWVLCSMPKYFYTQWSAPQGPNFRKYLDEQIRFINTLPTKTKNMISCRPYPFDYGWGDIDYLSKHVGVFNLADDKKTLSDLILNSMLTVYSYDCTTLQESMARNLPCIGFWQPEQFAWRESSRNTMEELMDVGIYHPNAIDAANFISSHIKNKSLKDWWLSNKTQKVRENYCRKYANTSDEEFRIWSQFIQEKTLKKYKDMS